MPMVNGRYYMNPQYGLALERDREAGAEKGDQEPTWLDHFLGLVPTDEGKERTSKFDANSSEIFREPAESGNPDELEAQNQNNEGTQQSQAQNTNQHT